MKPALLESDRQVPAHAPSTGRVLDGMRIALVRHSVRGRGSDVVADYFASKWAEAGAEVQYFHARNGFCPTFEPRHKDYRPLAAASRAGLIGELSVRSFRWADYVVTDFAPLLWALSHRNRRRLIYLAQGIDADLYEGVFVGGLFNRVLQRSLGRDHVPAITTGAGCADQLRARFGARVTLVREGEWFRLLDFADRHSKTEAIPRSRKHVVLSIVSRTFAKGPDVCLRILNSIPVVAAGEIEVWLVGDDLHWHLPNLLVRHWGRVPANTLAQLYRGADVFLFTSRSENFPSPPFEAMSQKCPVLTTYASGYVESGRNCASATTGSPDATARTLLDLFTCRLSRNKLIDEGITSVNTARARYAGRSTVAGDLHECITHRYA